MIHVEDQAAHCRMARETIVMYRNSDIHTYLVFVVNGIDTMRSWVLPGTYLVLYIVGDEWNSRIILNSAQHSEIYRNGKKV